MQVEHTGQDLVLTVADGELQRDESLIERATNLAYAIPTAFTLHVIISAQELSRHRKTFGTRWSGKKHLRLQIRNERA